MPITRTVSLLATVGGWLLVVTQWVTYGDAATDYPGYGVGLALGASGAIVFAGTILVNAARIYCLGHRHGFREGIEAAAVRDRLDA